MPAYVHTRKPYMKGAWGPVLGSQRSFPGDRVLQKAGLQRGKGVGAARQVAVAWRWSSLGSSLVYPEPGC